MIGSTVPGRVALGFSLITVSSLLGFKRQSANAVYQRIWGDKPILRRIILLSQNRSGRIGGSLRSLALSRSCRFLEDFNCRTKVL
jgi:hypothetical protein